MRRLDTPARVQGWLSSLPYNREERGETSRTLRGVVRTGTAHCFEAAVSAAAILEQHGHPPVLLDLESWDDLDHVLLLYREGGRWGTVAKSRDPALHGRKPVFRTLRALVDSYADGYVDATGRITGYGTLDLRTVRRDWRLAPDAWHVVRRLVRMPHRPFRMAEARYRRARGRYLAFKERHPDRRPVSMYAGREAWMGWPPPRRTGAG